ncbi:hypothetical protein MSG28_005752 [Choristoneura fumiferana]|uniref:Uncharacterized protein n=1 Tax=Choristoneura fumiferana TaxID=7141 RepID=A0ACC0L0M4_CHOFU|nr:hypothetical protein MSG28_005752 [Choristoneura fumiferana]
MQRNRMAVWKIARPPNYNTNINHIYPYSEIPYVGEYNLVRLPLSSTNFIEHVDYWEKGKYQPWQESVASPTATTSIISTNSKIPNRIPVISYTNCSTSSYIKDNSVKLVTLMGAPINKSCAKDIARMVNYDDGQVIVFGFEETQQDIKNLNDELKVIGLLPCHGYELPEKLQGLTLFGDNSHRVYTNITEMSEELSKRIVSGAYDSAVNVALKLDESGNNTAITDVILKSGPVKFMSKKYFKTIKLDGQLNKDGNRFAFGDGTDKSSEAVRWEIYPIWDNNTVFFKIKNVEHGSFLRIDDNSDGSGEKKILGSQDSNDLNYQWSFEPLKIDDDLMFRIIDRKYNLGWKLGTTSESYLCGSKAYGSFQKEGWNGSFSTGTQSGLDYSLILLLSSRACFAVFQQEK